MATPEEKDGMNEINTRLDTLINSIKDEIEILDFKLTQMNLQPETILEIKAQITSLTKDLETMVVIKNDLNSGEITNPSSVLNNDTYIKMDNFFSGGRRRTNKRRTKKRRTKRRKTKRRRARK